MMKKLISLLLILAMVAVMAVGCGKKDPGETKPAGTTAPANTEGEGTEPEQTQGNDESKTVEGTAIEILGKIYEQKEVEMMLENADVDFDSEFLAPQFEAKTGLSIADNRDAISGAALSLPMTGSQPYAMTVIRVKDAANAQTLAEQVKANVNLNHWICVSADDSMVVGYGDVVVIILSSHDNAVSAQDLADAFKTVCGGELDFAMEIPFEMGGNPGIGGVGGVGGLGGGVPIPQ